MPTERWEAVAGFPGYEVSNFGAVFSLKTQALLTMRFDEHGYLRVDLMRPGRRKSAGARIHTLVAAAFLGPRPDGLEVNHGNGVKYDNRVDNLEYVTPSANTEHAYRTGLKKPIRGNDHWKTAIPDEDLPKVRALYASGKHTMAEIGRMYGVSKGPVMNIIAGRRQVASGQPTAAVPQPAILRSRRRKPRGGSSA